MIFKEELLNDLKIVDYGYTEENLALSFDKFSKWVDEKKHRPLNYLADHRKEIRKDIKYFYPEFKSALIFLFDYSEEKKYLDEFYKSEKSNGLKISSYVFGFGGGDYHIEIRKRLDKIVNMLRVSQPKINVKLSLDVHPILERDLAHRSGLGWFGKNSMLINKKEGSFVMIAALLLDRVLDISKKELELDHCGTCRECITACPTDALEESTRTMIVEKCISTWTIELFKNAPLLEGHPNRSSGEIFGCDICQDVCPWNIKKLAKTLPRLDETDTSKLLIREFLTDDVNHIYSRLLEFSNTKYRKYYAHTPLERTGRVAMLKNLNVYI
ncbi:MAG: epoxyqueuosine reductase [Bacteriovoracaceae bacterium]|jgi:epoxyqueuosine reductase|nr:epoxyqueuosine reductase [Bacteriovoracaceae bacterium]